MTRFESYQVINEIYARHGKIFNTKEVQEYFDAQYWYVPVSKSYSLAEAQFNEYEKVNIQTVIAWQREQGYRD